jgi:hypothetical protein
MGMPGFWHGHSGTSSGRHHLQYLAIDENFVLISIFFCMLDRPAYLVFLKNCFCNQCVATSSWLDCVLISYLLVCSFVEMQLGISVPGESRVKSLMCSLVGNCNKKMD